MEDWNTRSSKSILEQRKEVEQRYGVKIGQMSITCSKCGKLWTGRECCVKFPKSTIPDTYRPKSGPIYNYCVLCHQPMHERCTRDVEVICSRCTMSLLR